MREYFKESNKFISTTNKLADELYKMTDFIPPEKREVIIKIVPKLIEMDNKRKQIRKVYNENRDLEAGFIKEYLKLSDKAKGGNSEKHLTALIKHLNGHPRIINKLLENYEAFKKFNPMYEALKKEMAVLMPN